MKYLFIVLFAILFAGCDYIEVSSCENGKDELFAGDLLSNDSQETYVQVIQTKDAKHVCVSKGSAHIFRK